MTKNLFSLRTRMVINLKNRYLLFVVVSVVNDYNTRLQNVIRVRLETFYGCETERDHVTA